MFITPEDETDIGKLVTYRSIREASPDRAGRVDDGMQLYLDCDGVLADFDRAA